MTLPKISAGVQLSTDSDDDPNACQLQERKIIVANFLPIHQERCEDTGKWCFSWDEDSLIFQLKDGFSAGSEIIYVGNLKFDIDYDEQDEVARKLFKDHRCIPTFLPPDVQKKFYHGFCMQQLWPLFHYMLPVSLKSDDDTSSLFKAYVAANNIFADRVMDAIRSYDDCVWVHDYHLMLLPTFLRKRVNRIKLGFFLHCPFPTSEIYTTLPVREEILKGLLNADLIGFHTFEYARHFLSCCKRMLGVDYACRRGYMELEYWGRTVSIKILPAGIHLGRTRSLLNLPSTVAKVQEIEQRFKGKTVILGVDDMDIFKGISMKFEGLESLLQTSPHLRGKVVMVQILNPPATATASSTRKEKDAKELVRAEAMARVARINSMYGCQGYCPLVIIDGPLHPNETVAYYVAADCCIVNAFRDGMNLVPYEYVICRQGTPEMDRGRGLDPETPRSSSLIVSEFIGCSPSLSGAYKVNPWSVEDISFALLSSIQMPEHLRRHHHEKHYRYVSSHDVTYWSNSFIQDLERACKDNSARQYWALGLGLDFRALALAPSFQWLSVNRISPSYQRASRRAIFLDYDGTLVPNTSISKHPSAQLLSILNTLCSDPKNTVFIVSGRDRASLDDWFSPCATLGLAAEHGFFIRWNKDSEWKSSSSIYYKFEWKNIAEPVMKLYTEMMDGSYIESKETALVWHYQYADPYFSPCQAVELIDHLESVLSDEPVVVKRGDHIVEVNPQGINKGLAVEKFFRQLVSEGELPDFVLCVGDDKSDEDMFETINNCTKSTDIFPKIPEVFACTVGRKPSKAKYFVDDTSEVIHLLEQFSLSGNCT